VARKSKKDNPQLSGLDEFISIVDGVLKFVLICLFAVPIMIGAMLGFTLFDEDM
jgi:hypothetical protein